MKKELDAVICLDEYGFIIEANKEMETLLGYGKEELLGKHFKKMVAIDDLPEAMEAFYCALSGREVVKFRFVLLNKKGEKIQVEASLSPLKDKGKIIGIRSIIIKAV